MRPGAAADADGGLPFPTRAVLTLALSFFLNIYSITSVFPYLAYYVVEAGGAPDVDGAGYWSGVITAAFMVRVVRVCRRRITAARTK